MSGVVAEIAVRGLVMGVAAAALMDAWSLVLRRGFGIPTLDYAMLGRWIGNVPRGRFVHERMSAAEPVPGERPLGWLAHYAIGVGFAMLLLVAGASIGPDPRRSGRRCWWGSGRSSLRGS